MNCPKCYKSGWKKFYNKDGSFYYACPSCKYETETIYPNNDKAKKNKEKVNR